MSASPGFVLWGLFLALGLVVGGYVVWMLATESRERRTKPPGDLREPPP